eukprot:1608472-Amphidinium_carterae.1
MPPVPLSASSRRESVRRCWMPPQWLRNFAAEAELHVPELAQQDGVRRLTHATAAVHQYLQPPPPGRSRLHAARAD